MKNLFICPEGVCLYKQNTLNTSTNIIPLGAIVAISEDGCIDLYDGTRLVLSCLGYNYRENLDKLSAALWDEQNEVAEEMNLQEKAQLNDILSGLIKRWNDHWEAK